MSGLCWKVCGITNAADAAMAIELGADALGFVFWPRSPRAVSAEDAASIAAEVPDDVLKVGVFVDATSDELRTAAEAAHLDVVQLHGNEGPEDCAAAPRPVWKALRLAPGTTADAASRQAEAFPGLTLLVDAQVPGEYGGTGEVADWQAAAHLAADRQVVLAGGLKPDNVDAAVEQVNPWGIDVSSGVEASPGIKDKDKLTAFSRAPGALPMSDVIYAELPDERGRFGQFGGRYVPETLIPALLELEEGHAEAMSDPRFTGELDRLLADFAGRPTPLYRARGLEAELGGATVWLKREDLLHTGAHKINNTIGQGLLAQRMGKHRVIAETGAGQHGVASATVAAMFGLDCTVYMGEEDIRRQKLNVFRMKLLGATVVPVTSGSRTLKDATNEAIRDWVTNVENTFYILGSVVGPHPYPALVRDFQAVIGREVKEQLAEAEEADPTLLVACVGGGSNAIGLFADWLDTDVPMMGVEAAGHGVDTDAHAATLSKGQVGVLHGALSYLLQDGDGQVTLPHSISAGLDYPGVGPQHSFLKDSDRVSYTSVTDEQAVIALQRLSRTEGIIPALETAHAIAKLYEMADNGELGSEDRIVVCLSGRGDKDVEAIAEHLEANPELVLP